MIIRIEKNRAAKLLQPEDLKGFKILADNGMDDAAILASLNGAGEVDGSGHVWIAQQWLRKASGLDSQPEWSANFGKMIDYAKSKGWVRDDGAIRGHVERA